MPHGNVFLAGAGAQVYNCSARNKLNLDTAKAGGDRPAVVLSLPAAIGELSSPRPRAPRPCGTEASPQCSAASARASAYTVRVHQLQGRVSYVSMVASCMF